jgi:hypothetical protein
MVGISHSLEFRQAFRLGKSRGQFGRLRGEETLRNNGGHQSLQRFLSKSRQHGFLTDFARTVVAGDERG